MTSRGKLSDYNDLIKIGSGGMSNVYRATHPLLHRKVVVKELNDKLADDPLVKERFLREAVTLAGLYHQNIVHVYDYWETKNNRYIVMEYVDGWDLHKTIEEIGVIPPEIALNIGVQILSALNYAHKKGIVHRDVKPHNVMISVHGEAKLMDFGIVIKNEDKSLTRPGTIIGTPNYMSPEQVVGDNLDFKSDLFSFGVLMYEMLTGILPFEEGPDGSVFTKIRTFHQVPIRTLRGHVPKPLCKIVDICLRKDAKKRYKSTLELLNVLKRMLDRVLKGLDVNEHLMKFLLEKDLYKSDRMPGLKDVERTHDFTQKVTKIVQAREEEFNAWRRHDLYRKLTVVAVVMIVLGFLAWWGYIFSTRYYRVNLNSSVIRSKNIKHRSVVPKKRIKKKKSIKYKKRGK